MIWANGIYYAMAFFINIFACRPRRKIWEPETPGACFNITALYISSAVFNTLSDVTLLTVPIIMVRQLQMSTKRKIGISTIFGTGAFATILAIVRIYFQMNLMHTEDMTYVHVQTGLLGYVRKLDDHFSKLTASQVRRSSLWYHLCLPSSPPSFLAPPRPVKQWHPPHESRRHE